jgi:hypothetical protein
MFRSAKLQREIKELRGEIDAVKILAAQPLVENIRNGKSPAALRDAEFKVFSQFGDDGIDKNGKLTHLTGRERFQIIASMDVFDLRQDKLARLGSLRS